MKDFFYLVQPTLSVVLNMACVACCVQQGLFYGERDVISYVGCKIECSVKPFYSQVGPGSKLEKRNEISVCATVTLSGKLLLKSFLLGGCTLGLQLPKCVLQHKKQYHRKILFYSFHLNGHTLGCHTQTQTLKPPCIRN